MQLGQQAFWVVQRFLMARLALLLALYAFSFLVFAIIRLFTGVSIKRLGYFSLRHISFSPKPGVHVYIGRLGFSVHRPTVARPGFLTLHVSNTEVTMDSEVVFEPDVERDPQHRRREHDGQDKAAAADDADKEDGFSVIKRKSKAFHILNFLLKNAKYFGKVIDLHASSTTLTFSGIGSVMVGFLGVKVDVIGAMTASHKFQLVGTLDTQQLDTRYVPVHAKINMTDFYLTFLQEKDATPREFLEVFSVEVEGYVSKDDLSLNEMGISVRMGKSVCYVDKMSRIFAAIKKARQDRASEFGRTAASPEMPAAGAESPPGGPDVKQGVLSRKDVARLTKIGKMLIRAVKEIEFKASVISVFGIEVGDGFTDENTGKHVTFAASIKDLWIDLRRMNPKNPGVKLFFSDSGSAHQAMVTLSSVNFGVTNGEVQEELIYVPMVTILSRTDLFSQTLRFVQDTTNAQNESVIRLTVNVASPTVNIETRHVPVLLRAMSSFQKKKRDELRKGGGTEKRRRPFALPLDKLEKLLPRVVMKIAIDEPGLRLVLSPKYQEVSDGVAKEDSMVVSSSSKVNIDLDSSHISDAANPHYSANVSMQVSQVNTFYRSPAGERHDIFLSETLFLKVMGVTSPKPLLACSGKLSNAHFYLTKYEIFNNVRDVFSHMKKGRHEQERDLMEGEGGFEGKQGSEGKPQYKVSPIRKLPPWLSRVKFEIADTAATVASELVTRTDDNVLRGVALKVSNSVFEYRREHSQEVHEEDPVMQSLETDGRRVGIAMQGIHGYKIVEPHGLEQRKENRFMKIPNVSCTLTTESANEKPITLCKVILRNAVFHHGIDLHFLFVTTFHLFEHILAADIVYDKAPSKDRKAVPIKREFMHIEFKSDNIRAHVDLPNHAKILLELVSFEAHMPYLQNPQVRALAIHLFSTHPSVKDAWGMILSLKGANGQFYPDAKEEADKFQLRFDGMRLNVPFGFELYKIVDNTVTMMKTIANLREQRKTHNHELVIPPKEYNHIPNIPKFRIKTPSFLLSLEDDHFESELGLIFELGLKAQRERLEKLEIFTRKAKKCSTQEMPPPEDDHTHKKSTERSRTEKKPRTHHTVPSGGGGSVNPKRSGGFSRRAMTESFEEAVHALDPNRIHHHVRSHFHRSGAQTGRANKVAYNMTDADDTDVKNVEVSIGEARRKLDEHFSTSWIREFREARELRRQTVKRNLEHIWVNDVFDSKTCSEERIVGYSEDPLLFSVNIQQADFQFEKVHFDEDGLRDFLFRVGKGQPKDSRYSIFVPLYCNLNCSELRMQVKDYPLPVVHFPPLHPSQNPRQPSLQIRGNLVIAEPLSHEKSNIRRLWVPLVPRAEKLLESEGVTPDIRKLVVEINRTLASAKFFTDFTFESHSLNPSRVAWGQSVQPALHTVITAMESFSKPPIDPSEKLASWDKIRYMFHAQWKFRWTDGGIYLLLLGSRSPYDLDLHTGFSMAWRKNATFDIYTTQNPNELFVVRADHYELGVPNYVAWEKDYLSRSIAERAFVPRTNYAEMTNYAKLVTKLSNNVEWKLGMRFQQDKEGSIERTDEFRPHYDIKLQLPAFVEDLHNYDAYKGFRSEYIHIAIGVSCNNDIGEDGLHHGEDADPAKVRNNALHITPRVLHQFRYWWSLFDGSMSLPIRNGALYVGRQAKKAKFSRKLATMQYQLKISPLFISFVHRHDSVHNSKVRSSTGLKAKVDKFVVDLHQRRQPHGEGMRWRMRMHLGEIDFKRTDVRVILAEFRERTAEDLLSKLTDADSDSSPHSSIMNEVAGVNGGPHSTHGSSSMAREPELAWHDFDDFVELDEVVQLRYTPKIKVLPLVYCPRWTYQRRTDKSDSKVALDDDGNEYVKFSEIAHECVIGRVVPEITTAKLLVTRLHEIDEQIATDDLTLDSLGKDLQNFPEEQKIVERIEAVQHQKERLLSRRQVILEELEKNTVAMGVCKPEQDGEFDCRSTRSTDENGILDQGEEQDMTSSTRFNNRFLFHSVQLIWNNDVRNAVYRYIHCAENRKKMYYLVTRRAVKNIEDLVARRDEELRREGDGGTSPHEATLSLKHEDVSQFVSEMLKHDEEAASEHRAAHKKHSHGEDEGIVSCRRRHETIFTEMRKVHGDTQRAVDSYIVRFITPQIQLVSEQNPNQCVSVTSRTIDLTLVSIEDSSIDDEDSKVLETRYGVLLEEAQFYVLNKDSIFKSALLLNSSNYGSSSAQAWPPWLGIETAFDGTLMANELIVEKTTVVMRYDKPNPLHLSRSQKMESESDDSSSSDVNIDSQLVRRDKYRLNRTSVDFPKVVATCDSQQYFAAYTIAMDLLVYSEPVLKEQNERLERVILASDFRDLNKAVERMTELQGDIYKLGRIRHEFLTRMDVLDEKGIKDMLTIDVEVHKVYSELMIMMEAIRIALQKERQDMSKLVKWAIASDQIIWHVLDDARRPLVDVGLADASFNRIENGEGFNTNSIEVGMLQGFNLTPNAAYPEIVSPFTDESRGGGYDESKKVFKLRWTMLEPIGGIPIMELLECYLQPVKVQLERDTGNKIFAYLFPKGQESPFNVHKPRPRREAEEDASMHTDSDSETLSLSTTNDAMSINSGTSGVTKSSNALVNFGRGLTQRARTGLSRNDSPATATAANSETASLASRTQKAKAQITKNDAAEMYSRASNYVSIVKVLIHGTTVCVSYKVSDLVEAGARGISRRIQQQQLTAGKR